MKKQHILLLIFSLYLLKPIADAKTNCSPASCGPMQPEVRFPFRIIDRQPAKCGFPGFDLSCDEQGKTVLQLPSSLSYVVKDIYYVDQIIYIDPDFCGPNRIISVNMTDSPFSSSELLKDYTFYNCPKNHSFKYMDIPFPCLSNGSYSVIAVEGFVDPGYLHSNCTVMTTIEVPGNTGFINNELDLRWYTPGCGICEFEGKVCRLKSKNGDVHTICVSSSSGKGISRSVKYGLSIGLGVPALICIIGLVYYLSSKGQHQNNSNNQAYQGIDLSSLATIPQPGSRLGLDGPTIESYPKTVVGDSCSLPHDDRTCAICLSDYKPKESLRTIPECNHYFHATCIDEWLKLNATCPVCRKIPESSALVIIPCSKASSSNSGGLP